jgi:mRNA-degrading endonuclease RelE of RelBE toxin-antitoxin system
MTTKKREPYEVILARQAEEEILGLRGYDQRRLRDAMANNLRHEPLMQTRNRKPLETRPELVAFVSELFADGPPLWELRVGEWRVAYLVRGRQVLVLRVAKKGRKTTGEVLS